MTTSFSLRTCSKAFGMAALRLGFAVANDMLTGALRAVKSPYNVNSVTQKIGAAVLRRKEELQKALAEILNSRNFLLEQIKQIGGEFPQLLYRFWRQYQFCNAGTGRAGEAPISIWGEQGDFCPVHFRG